MSGTERGVHGGGVERRGFRVWGRVQGVGFRWATAREAEALGLKGVVRNRADGAVEVSAEGSAEALEDLASWLRRGPRGARVERVEVTGAELPIPAAGFRIG